MAGKYMKRWPKGKPLSLEWLRRWVIDVPESGCWIWMGSLNKGGYGSVGYKGKTSGAHRAAYELKCGPIPSGLDLDHLCRVRCCINPDHLEPVSRSENLKRGEAGENIAAPLRKVTHCPKGHCYSSENTYIDKKGRRSCKECARESTREWRRKRKSA